MGKIVNLHNGNLVIIKVSPKIRVEETVALSKEAKLNPELDSNRPI